MKGTIMFITGTIVGAAVGASILGFVAVCMAYDDKEKEAEKYKQKLHEVANMAEVDLEDEFK